MPESTLVGDDIAAEANIEMPQLSLQIAQEMSIAFWRHSCPVQAPEDRAGACKFANDLQ